MVWHGSHLQCIPLMRPLTALVKLWIVGNSFYASYFCALNNSIVYNDDDESENFRNNLYREKLRQAPLSRRKFIWYFTTSPVSTTKVHWYMSYVFNEPGTALAASLVTCEVTSHLQCELFLRHCTMLMMNQKISRITWTGKSLDNLRGL